MDEADRGCGHAARHEFVFDRLIDGELGGVFGWGAAVAEHDLQCPGAGRRAGVGMGIGAMRVAVMDTHGCVGDCAGAAVSGFGQVGQPWIQRHVAPVVADFEWVVASGIA